MSYLDKLNDQLHLSGTDGFGLSGPGFCLALRRVEEQRKKKEMRALTPKRKIQIALELALYLLMVAAIFCGVSR